MIKQSFFTGLILILPIMVTIALVIYIVNFLTGPFEGFFLNILTTISPKFQAITSNNFLVFLTKIFILIILIFLVTLVGFLARTYFLAKGIEILEFIFKRIPILNKIYNAIQDVVKNIFASKTSSFKETVLVPFPNKEKHVIGFLTGPALEFSKNTKTTPYQAIFVPTAPSPICGYIVMYKEEDVKKLDLSVEIALKYTVSCGVLDLQQP